MSKKTRMLFALFITLPFIISSKDEAELNPYLIFGHYDQELSKKIMDFYSKNAEEKEKILKDLDISISDLNKEIKAYISEKKESPNEKIVELIKKLREMIHYLPFKYCNNDENCVNEKKTLMNNVINAVEDHFGQCSATREHLNKLTNNAYTNLELITKLVDSIIRNIDLLGANNAKTVQSIITCLIQGTPEFWPAVKEQLTKDGHSNSEPLLKELFGRLMTEASIKISEFIKNEESKKYSKIYDIEPEERRKREQIFEEEILNILKEIKDSKSNNTLTIIVSCLATITILIGGFFLYRFIRRRKNSDPIENTKDLVNSENK